MYCKHCGEQVQDGATFCPHCGARLSVDAEVVDNGKADSDRSDKSWIACLLLCVFAGSLGIHRFYVGKIGTGILWLLTCGCLGIGTLVDLIMIAVGQFTDVDGRFVKPNELGI